jgi:hypothetical protein
MLETLEAILHRLTDPSEINALQNAITVVKESISFSSTVDIAQKDCQLEEWEP